MARKPSIILTVADKQSAAKDLRAELKRTKTTLKELLSIASKTAKAITELEKETTELEAKIAAMT